MRNPTFALAVLPAAALLAGCGAAAPASAPATAPAVAPPAPSVSASSAATVPAAPAVPASWVMPDLVGSNLQDAQDAIQSLTGFGIAVTISHDATGDGRNQVLDRNWKVCSQNLRPGTAITADTRIDFGTVKLEERC